MLAFYNTSVRFEAPTVVLYTIQMSWDVSLCCWISFPMLWRNVGPYTKILIGLLGCMYSVKYPTLLFQVWARTKKITGIVTNGNVFKGRQLFSLNLCNVNKMLPSEILLHLRIQNSHKERDRVSKGGGWDTAIILFLAKKLKAGWARALSWCKKQSLLCYFSGRFHRRLSHNRFNTFK
jgi:hypothetical protein